jgi:hypothetical protein
MMATIEYCSGSSCTSPTIYGGDSGTGFIQCNSAATNAVEAWVEIDDYGDECYHCSNGTTATTMKYYTWPRTGTSTAISAKNYNYYVRFRKRTQMWCEAGNWFIGTNKYKYVAPPKPKPGDRLREIIQARHAPMVLVSRKPILTPQDEREIRARETLFRVIGADKFQKFLKDGFVSVRAKSGLVYQIFPGHGVTAVYRDGEQIERLCVVLKGDFPPTDSLIMRYLIILNDEARFRSYAIKHQVIVKKPQIVADERSLTEIFRELKKVA